MQINPPKRIVLEEDIAEGPIASNLRQSPSLLLSISVVERVPERTVHDPELLEVVAFRGRLLKSCPGTRHYFCCGYRILHFGMQCSLGCTYCILQAYLNQPNLRLFGNIGGHSADAFRRASFPPWTGYIGSAPGSSPIPCCSIHGPAYRGDWSRFLPRQPNAVLELKTKTPFIENLADLDHGGRTIVAWSLNAEAIVRGEEPPCGFAPGTPRTPPVNVPSGGTGWPSILIR